MEAVYGLLGYADPKTGATHLVFLQSLTPSNGGRVWTLVLHKNLRFSDGTPFNAAAIEFNIKRGADPNSGDSYRNDLSQLRTTVVDATTLKLTLPGPDTQFDLKLMQDMPFVASPTAVQREGSAFATHPVGAGPFKLTEWTQNATMTMIPNPYYARFAPGQPYLSQLTFQDLSTGPTQELNALAANTAQMAWVNGDQQMATARAGGSKVDATVSGGGEWLVFNTTQPPFNNIKARQAVSLAMSHSGLAAAWAPGVPTMTSWVPQGSPLYSPAYTIPGPDSAQAKQLFSQLASSGDPVQFTITVPSFYVSAADYVQSALSQYAGVSVKVQQVLTSAFLTDQATGNFTVTMGGAAWQNPYPSMLAYIAPNGATNFGHWNDAAVGTAISKILASSSVTEQKAEWSIIQREILAQYPFFTAQGNNLGLAYRPNIGGVTEIEFGTIPLFAQLYLK
jgi:peptide/nickel transport system substrate-binding protein